LATGTTGHSDQQSLVPVRVQGLASRRPGHSRTGILHLRACGRQCLVLGAQLVHSGWLLRPRSPMGKDPMKIDGLPSGLQAIAAGCSNLCAGERQCLLLGTEWSSGSFQPVCESGFRGWSPALPSAVRAIAAGGDYVCALLDDGLMCWGSNWNMGSVLPAASRTFHLRFRLSPWAATMPVPWLPAAYGAGARITTGSLATIQPPTAQSRSCARPSRVISPSC